MKEVIIMFWPYASIGDMEIVHSPVDCKGNVSVHIEKPDDKVCFKVLDITIPNLEITNSFAFNISEVEILKAFCKANTDIMFESAKKAAFGTFLNEVNGTSTVN